METPKEESSPFQADVCEQLKAAFESAWENIVAAGSSPYADPELAVWARDTLARHVLEMAKVGELDLDRLREGALIYQDRSRESSDQPSSLLLSGV